MGTHLFFDFETRPEPTDPTGDPCEKCKDIPYLKAWLWLILIDGRVTSRIYLCESCTDALRNDSD